MMARVEFAGGLFWSKVRESVKQSDDVALLEEKMFAWERDMMMIEMDGFDEVEFVDGRRGQLSFFFLFLFDKR